MFSPRKQLVARNNITNITSTITSLHKSIERLRNLHGTCLKKLPYFQTRLSYHTHRPNLFLPSRHPSSPFLQSIRALSNDVRQSVQPSLIKPLPPQGIPSSRRHTNSHNPTNHTNQQLSPHSPQIVISSDFPPPVTSKVIAQRRAGARVRNTTWRIFKWLLLYPFLALHTLAGIFLLIEHRRRSVLNDFAHVYFPQDLSHDLSTLGFVDSLSTLMMEQLITSLHAVYLLTVHPHLAPTWVKDMVTKDGRLIDPLEEQQTETLADLLDILTASQGMNELTTIFSQMHRMFLQQQLTAGGRPDGFFSGELYDRLKSTWSGSFEELEAYMTLDRYETEASICLPLVREQLHKNITALLVPPQPQVKAAAAATGILDSVMNFFWSPSPSEAPVESKSPQFLQLKALLDLFYSEGQLPLIVKNRRAAVEPAYNREGISLTASLNGIHHAVQVGRLETLQFILQSLRAYEMNVVLTPHNLQQYAGDNQTIMSLDDCRELIVYCQTQIHRVSALVEKYRPPITEQLILSVATFNRLNSFAEGVNRVFIGTKPAQIANNTTLNDTNPVHTIVQPFEFQRTSLIKTQLKQREIMINEHFAFLEHNELPQHNLFSRGKPIVPISEENLQQYIQLLQRIQKESILPLLTRARILPMPTHMTTVFVDASNMPRPEDLPPDAKFSIPIINPHDPELSVYQGETIGQTAQNLEKFLNQEIE